MKASSNTLGFRQVHSSEASAKGWILIRRLQRSAKKAGAQARANHTLVSNSNQWTVDDSTLGASKSRYTEELLM